ncbi:putative UvrD/REP helicase family protein [Agrobacterium fabacearum CFBP 5771]|uniref:UvrD-helicase domain-containing protein n=1 Tax=Agrobacterium tumefaciens TaxID=358 RepID=UPI0009BB0E79|nr:ATP-dependent helicase [Agrobacterium tumefaciens]CVI20251.1 putative UvrD/REP helicase family protein [Agrobacterium fabacearum CFBP 5771]
MFQGLISPHDWLPVGIAELESAAMDAVRARGSTLVTAGPGAGKTELLGQRGVFLLQTGICPYPRRILAISFKRDAAKNLRNRFERRCTPDQASRLDSLTFDAFAKQLFDRFWRALPAPWALAGTYQIALNPNRYELADFQREIAEGIGDKDQIGGFLEDLLGVHPTKAEIMGLNSEKYNFGIQTARLSPLHIPDAASFLHVARLYSALHQDPAPLTFPMIGRLVEAIMDTNPTVRNAIRATYSHLFMDEFQDTTSVQYGVMYSIFKGSDTIITAVGDDKQKIMGWAGAHKDAFGAFSADFLSGGLPFNQTHLRLTLNYRSNARIVEILNTLKNKIAPHEADFKATRPAPALPNEQICAVIVSDTEALENTNIAKYLAAEIKLGTPPRQIGLLVRQKAIDWEKRLAPHLRALGIGLRNEDRQLGGASIQDLMAEPYAQTMMDFLELLCLKRGGIVWARAVETLLAMEGLDSSEGGDKADKLVEALDSFVNSNKVPAPSEKATAYEVETTLDAVEKFLLTSRLKSLAPQYQQGDFLDQIRGALRKFFTECAADSSSWLAAIKLYRGDDQVPLMTITKSKGLEYDLVLLLGLDDNQWWSFASDPTEGHSNFFVAASRARERLFMFFCKGNGTKKIAEIYSLLKTSSVTGLSGDNWVKSRENDLANFKI